MARTHSDGDWPHGNEFTATLEALETPQTFVSDGCLVDQGTDGTDMDIRVNSGTVIIDDAEVSVSEQTLTVAAADANDRRYDVVSVDSNGTASLAQGTASSEPTAEDTPSGEIYLAIVQVDAGTDRITDSDLKDGRVFANDRRFSFINP